MCVCVGVSVSLFLPTLPHTVYELLSYGKYMNVDHKYLSQDDKCGRVATFVNSLFPRS